MSLTAKTDLLNVIPTIWSEKWYPELRKNLVFGEITLRDYDGEISQKGSTVRVTQINAPDGEVITDDSQQFASEKMSFTNMDIVADMIASASFEFTDIGVLQSIKFENEAKAALLYAVSKKIEDTIISKMIPSPSAPDHTIAPAAAGSLVSSDVLGIRTLLSVQSVPMSERYMVLSPSYYSDLLGQQTLTSSDFIPAGSPVSTGLLGRAVYGFDTMESQNLGNDVGYAFHKSAVASVMQKGLSIKISDLHAQNKYAYLISASVIFGVKLMSNVRLVQISG